MEKGSQSTQMPDLHDVEIEYVVKKIGKDEAQSILYDLPEHVYVTDRYYDEVNRRFEFTVYLDDVPSTDISEFLDYMDSNHERCHKKFIHLHDYRTAHDAEDRERWNEESEDLSKYESYRTLP